MPAIEQALTRLYNRYRIVFWHDAKNKLRDEFELPRVKSWAYEAHFTPHTLTGTLLWQHRA